MASLVESTSDLLAGDEERLRYMAFSEAMMAAEEFASPLYDLHEETWHELYLRPSPPVTPDCLSPATSSPVPEEVKEDLAESLLCNIMEYEQIMDALHEAEFALTACPPQDDLLIQDCMWSGSTVDESKPSSMAGQNSIDGTEISKPISSQSESECIEPSVIFPSLHNSDQKSTKIPNVRNAGAKSTVGPVSSESEEEIDVVTVEHRCDQNNDSDTIHRRHSNNSYPIKSSPSGVRTAKKTTSTVRAATSGTSSNALSSNKSIPRRKRHGKRQSRLGGLQDGNESDEEARRASHNVLERKRRNDLKNSFDVLRMGIPDLEENVRAPKVVILRKAVEYIKLLQNNDRKVDSDLLREQKRYNKLKDRLSYLTSMPATI